jgi:hypothetical protein
MKSIAAAALVVAGLLITSPIFAQSRALYAFVRVPLLDASGNPVLNRTGQPMHGEWCIAWPSNGSRSMWWTQTDDDPTAATKEWMTGIRYYVNLAQRTVTVGDVRFWKIVRGAATDPVGERALMGTGWKLAAPLSVHEYITFQTHVVLNLYDQPKAEWNKYLECNWQQIVAHFETHEVPGSGGGFPPGYKLPYWLTHPNGCIQGYSTAPGCTR